MDRGGVFDSSALTSESGVFSVPPDHAALQRARQQMQRSVAVRVKARMHARFAHAQSELQALLPPTFAAGDSYSVLSNGDIDALSYVRHIMTHEQFAAVVFACWAISRPAIEFLAEQHDRGHLQRVDAYVGEIMPRDRPALHTMLCDLVRRTGGRVVAMRNHAKVWMFLGARRAAVVMQTSANPNYNRRIEQTCIQRSAAIARAYKTAFDAIDLPTPNFPSWTPYAW